MTDWVVDGILKQYEDLCNQHGANYKTRLESLTRVVNMYYGSLWYDDTNETNKKLAPVNKLLFSREIVLLKVIRKVLHHTDILIR